MSPDQKIQVSMIVLLAGLVIVFIVLLSLTRLIKSYGAELKALQSNPAARTKAAPAAALSAGSAVVPAVQAGISEETVAVISAAVYALYGASAGRVTGIRRSSQPSRSAWGMAGLLESTRPF
ncbi:OadG family transporter subunit [Clostridium sp. KNHs216]|uniref:OadG family transporter subunit n=1 Tax=Clostridium sp. KNHs216 TaxID=1550235 RepID=UPI0011523FA0|nr:OadG family transporter subunit [Clostridium sp. KNHs216]TQI65376.1 oxaloacetate decarboxylase gamma subunit [Clostridium sp. KNHs216]TQI69126.1 oxaloacetate decarboxylase gamma subunit [Clostridium sp. KNHs216]